MNAMKPFLIAAAFVFAILILGWTSERPSTQIDIGDGFIASGHYAVVEEAKLGGSTLFLGSSAGIPMLAFHSDDQLYNPFIVDSARVLLVEGHSGSGFNYRLLDIHLDGANVTCRRLVESMQYIGYPVVPSGSRKNEVWFFSGKYNAKATGIPVNKHRLTALIDRKVEFFNGPTFLTISRPTQIKEDQFIAASPMIQTGKHENDKFAENKLLVDLLTDGMKLDAKAADFQQIPDATIKAVTSLAGSQQLLVLSYTVWGGKKYLLLISRLPEILDRRQVRFPKSAPIAAYIWTVLMTVRSPSGLCLKLKI